MKKIASRFFLFIPFLFFSFYSFAQYKTIYPERTTFYERKTFIGTSYGSWQNFPKGIYIPVKIEKQTLENEDTIYHNYRVFIEDTFLDNKDLCKASNKAYAWTGKKIILTKDSMQVFINNSNDSLYFPTFGEVNDSWVFTVLEDGYYKGTIVKKDLETISLLGKELIDSVLTISIDFKNKSDHTALYSHFNGVEWKISKKYGFVKTFDILRFPADTSTMLLAGIDVFNLGVKNLTEKEIYNYEPGDEFHIREAKEWGFHNVKEINTIQKVLSKQNIKDSDTVVYQIAVTENILIKDSGKESFLVNNDIISLRVPMPAGSEWINKLPLKSTEDTSLHNRQFVDEKSSIMVKWLMRSSHMPTGIEDSCFTFVTDIEKNYVMRYYEGVGGPFYLQYFYGGSTIRRDLIYFKKQSKEWGTPINLVLGLPSNKFNLSVSISPNPATDHIKISSEGVQNTFYNVYNNEGREVLYGSLSSTEETININNLKSGIYLVMISKEGDTMYATRFVKN